jgi:hypothetical protein
MDQSGNKIRGLLSQAGRATEQADRALSQAQGGMGGLGPGGSPSEPGCYALNLRGECAHPNLTSEYGLMSWREYDALKAAGKDPREVSYHNMNRPMPWLNNPQVRGR